MSSFECGKCGSFFVPDELTDEQMNQIGELTRRFGRLAAVPYWLPISMDPAMAKSIALHITEKKGLCLCGAQFTAIQGNCVECGVVNLDW